MTFSPSFSKGGKILGALMLLMSVTEAAKMLKNPLRIRINTELISNVFHKKDQDLLRLLQDVPLGDYSLGDNQIKGLKISFEPSTGLIEDFDYKLSLNQDNFLGIESDKLKFKGTGQISHGGSESGEDFTIEGPVDNIRLSFEVTKDVLTKTSG
jgi:hypothetical protein